MCPKAWLACVADSELSWNREYRWLRDYGVLPRAGGMLDQGARFVEAIDIIEAEWIAIGRINAKKSNTT